MRLLLGLLALAAVLVVVACGDASLPATLPVVEATATLPIVTATPSPPAPSPTSTPQGVRTFTLSGQALADYQQGLARYLAGDPDAVVDAFSRVIQAQPDYLRAYLLRGALNDTRELAYDQAVADFTRALELQPDLRSAYYGRARSYHDKGDYDLAIADYNRALQFPDDRTIPDYELYLLVPLDDVNIYIDRGRAYQDKHEWDRALADLSQAIALDPIVWRARLVRGGVYEAKGDKAAAIADYQAVLQMTDQDEILSRARKRLKILGVENP